jgi:hypothetical protein
MWIIAYVDYHMWRFSGTNIDVFISYMIVYEYKTMDRI